MRFLICAFGVFAILSACAQPSAAPVLQPEVQLVEPESGATATATEEVLPVGDSSIKMLDLSNNRGTVDLKVGESLQISRDVYDWSVESSDTEILAPQTDSSGEVIFTALQAGTVSLSGTGNPTCLTARPPCMSPSILLELTVVIE